MPTEEAEKLQAAIDHQLALYKAEKVYGKNSDQYNTAAAAYTDDDKALINKWGINFENNVRDKEQISRKVGDEIEYVVPTEVPAGSVYGNLKWSDSMTNGLTFNRGSVTIEAKKYVKGTTDILEKTLTLTKDVDYYTVEDDRGFDLIFTAGGLKKLAEFAKDGDVLITLKYKATVNTDAVVDKPDTNDVSLEYDNKPVKESEPLKPVNQQIKVTKTWAEGDAPSGVKVTYTLYEVTKDGDKQVATVTKEAAPYEHTFENLNNDKQYKVVESVVGYTPEYKVTEADGTVTVTNTKEENPTEVTPKEGQIQVNKTWADGTAPTDVSVTYTLYRITTKAGVAGQPEAYKAITVKSPNFKATFYNLPLDNAVVDDPETEADETKAADETYTYFVKERVSGYTPEYAVNNDDGSVTITNTKKDGPTPLNPSEPSVVTHGKRFVKADATTGERLQGAEFIVKNNNGATDPDNGKYLALKDKKKQQADDLALENAKKAYYFLIDEWNKAVKANPEANDTKIKLQFDDTALTEADVKDILPLSTKNALNTGITGKDDVQTEIDKLHKRYVDAYNKAKNGYVWVDKNDANAVLVVLISDDQGKFEITGLREGDYTLEETKAPSGYADRKNTVNFRVEDGSYDREANGVIYEGKDPVENQDDKAAVDAENIDGIKGEAIRVNNKKVTIPQTGGIGSVIFVIAGLLLMGLAAYKIKSNRQEELR